MSAEGPEASRKALSSALTAAPVGDVCRESTSNRTARNGTSEDLLDGGLDGRTVLAGHPLGQELVRDPEDDGLRGGREERRPGEPRVELTPTQAPADGVEDPTQLVAVRVVRARHPWVRDPRREVAREASRREVRRGEGGTYGRHGVASTPGACPANFRSGNSVFTIAHAGPTERTALARRHRAIERSRATTPVTIARTRSTSSSETSSRKLNLSVDAARRAENPMARRTGLASVPPTAQALPVETATPSRSRLTRSASPSHPSNATFRGAREDVGPGGRRATCPGSRASRRRTGAAATVSRGTRSVRVRAGMLERHGETGRARDVLRAPPHAFFLDAPALRRHQRGPPPDEERADAPGAAELVAREGDQVDAERRGRHVEEPRREGRVAVTSVTPASPGARGDGGYRQHRPGLVIRGHQARHGGACRRGADEGVGIDGPVGARRDAGDLEAGRDEAVGGVEDRGVFDRGDDDASSDARPRARRRGGRDGAPRWRRS